jgi:hypothetical protein
MGADLSNEDWERNEPGWYTLRGVGGIVHERDGWYFYPMGGGQFGPYSSLAKAKAGGNPDA